MMAVRDRVEGPEDFARAFGVSRETTARLEIYAGLLARWNPAINLVSPSTLPETWHRHFADSAQLLDLAPESATRWLDLGSGAGFPGLVIALLAAERRPQLAVTLVESDGRKTTFLAAVARATGIAPRLLTGRIERLVPEPHDVISARALAPLPDLLAHAAPWLAPGGTCLFPKGARRETELTEARAAWHYRCVERPSRTEPEAAILVLSEVQRGG